MQIIFREDGIVRKIVNLNVYIPTIGDTILIRTYMNNKEEVLKYTVVNRVMDIGHLRGQLWLPEDVIWHIDIKKQENASAID